MRILVLYPGLYEERRQLLAPHKWRLRLTGTSLVLADDRVHSADAAAFGDALLLPPAEDAAAVWEVLARYLERHPVDGIVAQSEAGLLIGARVAQEFGVRGPTVAGAMATVNKFSTRTLLTEAGVAQPAFELVSSVGEVKRFAREHGWPIILKATASSRQRLVTRVAGEEEVEGAVARMLVGLPLARDVRRMLSFAKLDGLDLGLDPRKEFLVEAFQRGIPLECDAMLSGTTPHWFGVCEQLPSRARRFFIEGYLLPSRLGLGANEAVQALAQTAVQALGLTNTGTSVELRMAEEGPRIIEVNGRLPWDEGFQEFVEAATGHVPVVLALKLAMGRKLPQLRLRRHASLLYLCNYEAGLVQSTPDAKQWKRRVKAARAAWLFTHEGEELLVAEHPDSRPHVAGVLTTDRHSADRALERGRKVLEGLQVEIRPRSAEVLVAQVPGSI